MQPNGNPVLLDCAAEVVVPPGSAAAAAAAGQSVKPTVQWRGADAQPLTFIGDPNRSAGSISFVWLAVWCPGCASNALSVIQVEAGEWVLADHFVWRGRVRKPGDAISVRRVPRRRWLNHQPNGASAGCRWVHIATALSRHHGEMQELVQQNPT